MKIFKGLIAFLLFVFCLGFVAGLSNKDNINWDLLFSGKETEVITDEVNETSVSQDTEALTSDLQESTSEPQESMTEVSSDEVDFSKLSMNCLGDSVTHGAACPTYVPALQEILGVEFCRNYGQGGSTICTARETPLSFVDRYSSMDDDADIILVFGGFNDVSWCSDLGCIDDFDTDTFYGALNTLVIGLQEKYPDAYIFFVAPYKRFNLSTGQMISEAVSNYGIPYVDFNNAIRVIGEKYNIDVLDLWELDLDENSTIDSLHPTVDFANNVLAPTIAQFIKDNYKKPN